VSKHSGRLYISKPESALTPNPADIGMSNNELAVSYAALILADDGVEITVRHHKVSKHYSATFRRPQTNTFLIYF
jgi:hypothetical protein